uniref:Acyl-coenzyme A oxidase n=1 Tax=Wollemia nobilis TaxID=56998 RepID=A0A0C9S4N3_9CONI
MEDLARERAQATLDVNAMKILWAGGEEAFHFHNKLASLVAADPVFLKEDKPRLTRKELFLGGIRKAARCRELAIELGLSEGDARTLRTLRDDRAYDDLHWNMFVPVLRTQATPEQQRKWLPLATSMAIIGCYAQTELGHGSNVQGLETTATFDPSTDEFILNSPTLTSTKWWPGGLGKVATHAIVHARLILEKDYGVHAFIVQIRSLEDHKPLTTITVGDIGVKFGNGGNNSVDNGFLQFNHTRIPRTNLLMRMAIVTREGKYVRQNVPKQILYGGMIAAREIILMEASLNLSRAVTIAVRYSAVRRQFGLDDGNREIQVLDYITQQQKLFPLLATAYAFRIAGQWMELLYSEVMSQFESNNFSGLAEIHACTSGLKAITTSVTADAIEECRKACGGHGYLCSSGLPQLFAEYIPACTYEGDNTLLFIQVGKFIIKTILNMRRSPIPQGTAEYLTDIDMHTTKCCEVSQDDDWSNSNVILDAFKARAARLALPLSKRIQNFPNQDDGFEELSLDLVKVAEAHCQLIVLSKFVDKLQTDIPGLNVKQQLQLLCNIYGLSLLCDNIGDFLATGYMTKIQGSLARYHLRSLFSHVRPNAIALVDSFNHTDHYLGSVLGRYDGDVYTHLYVEALKDPFNSDVTDGYEEYLKPILKKQVMQVSKL